MMLLKSESGFESGQIISFILPPNEYGYVYA